MKTSVASLLLFLLTSLLPGQDIPRGANAVMITGGFTRDAKFNEITSLLLESGVDIAKADKDVGSITTSPKPFKNGNLMYSVFIRDSIATIRGKWCSDIVISMYGVTTNPNQWQEITYGGQKGSPKRNAWDAFRSLADKIPGDHSYELR